MQARWRSENREPSRNPTTVLLHCSDKHGISGILPNFEAGETWTSIHEAAHESGKISKEHRHDS